MFEFLFILVILLEMNKLKYNTWNVFKILLRVKHAMTFAFNDLTQDLIEKLIEGISSNFHKWRSKI